ncbi:MAG TPA: branched-chain amino acid ABC transporter permease [Hyphomicrobiaceae bacterium]|nr:branched-chain amino acid ABC transporter permease [Hyphomicrobiaceae bacterium]
MLGFTSHPSRLAWLTDRAVLLHVGVLAALLAAQLVLSDYAILSLARVMVLAVYAVGYNILFGYTGLLSLGHAMLFAAGLYGAGLSALHLGLGAPAAFLAGIAAGAVVSLLVGLIVLRTSGVAFMIVTLMFAQAGYLTSLYFGEITRGDEGFALRGDIRHAVLPGGLSLDLTSPLLRYNLALGLLAVCLLGCLALVRSGVGRVLVAIRENEERTRMLGYDVQASKLLAFVVSGTAAAAAGAAYALLFAYVGATFASIQYSILPLLWVLLGGAGTVLGPLVGTLVMFYLVDVSSEYTSAYMLLVGIALLVLVVWAPKGLLGTLRERIAPWLP